MEWTADVSAGDWLRERLDATWDASMHGVVPRGFPAYARIFHPATRDRPVGMPWPPLPYGAHAREWDAFQASNPEIDVAHVTWSETARAVGTRMHPLAQWHRLVGIDLLAPHREDGPRDADGWRYSDPDIGKLEPHALAATAQTLVAHTGTPDDGFVAVWEGWGGLVGAVSEGPGRAFVQLTQADASAPAALDQHNEMLQRSMRDPFNNVFRKAEWQPGILPDDVSKGARLELPGRGHVLFRGGAAELASPDWVLHAPWRDRVAEAHGFAPDAQSPSLMWPSDRAWALVSEIDFDSTIVGGSAELVEALCADPRIEALPLNEGADLTSEGDRLNR